MKAQLKPPKTIWVLIIFQIITAISSIALLFAILSNKNNIQDDIKQYYGLNITVALLLAVLFLCILAISTLYFVMRGDKMGWRLLMFTYIYAIWRYILAIYLASTASNENLPLEDLGDFRSGSIGSIFWSIVILALLNRKKVRDYFNISNHYQQDTFVITIISIFILTVLFNLPFFL